MEHGRRYSLGEICDVVLGSPSALESDVAFLTDGSWLDQAFTHLEEASSKGDAQVIAHCVHELEHVFQEMSFGHMSVMLERLRNKLDQSKTIPQETKIALQALMTTRTEGWREA